MLKLGGLEQTEHISRLGGPEQKLGSRARAGSAQARRLEDAALSFYSTCTVPYYQALSALCRCQSPYRAFFFDQKRMRLRLRVTVAGTPSGYF